MPSLARALAILAASARPACCLFGSFEDHTLVPAMRFAGPEGAARGLPTVLRVPLGLHESCSMGKVGDLAYDALFAGHYPPFVVNVSFACARPRLGRSEYADPTSIWFNVFAGFYQIDVSPKLYQHPFGYKEEGGRLVIDAAALARLGKADWNYFSNHVYGVPRAVVEKYNRICPHDVRDDECEPPAIVRDRVAITTPAGVRYWDEVELRKVKVVSAYEAEDDLRLEDTFGDLTQLWQIAFGTARPSDRYPKSFVGTRMRAVLWLSWSSEPTPEGVAFHTYVFGATVNEDWPNAAENEELLEAEQGALRGAIAETAPERGFDGPR